MANMKLGGVFLGGAVDSAQQRDRVKLGNRQADQQDRLIGMQEDQFKASQQAAIVKMSEERLADTIKQVGDLLKAVQSPEDRQKIRGTITALGQQAAFFASQAGRDPNTILQRIETEFNLVRTPEEMAKITGAAKGTEAQAAAPGQSAAAGMTATAEATARQAVESSPAAIAAAANRAGAVAQATAAGTAKGTPQKAQTDAAKAIQDRELFIKEYGENSPQVKAFDEASASSADLSDVGGARKEYMGASKDFVVMRDAFSKIAAATANPSAAGDLSAIFSFMKILDPGSVVREQEFANAQNAAGVPDRVRNVYNRLLSGERLADAQREDFKNQAENLFRAQLRNQLALESQYKGIAQRNKMRPEDVIVDLVGEYRQALQPPPPAGGSNDNDPLGLRGKQ